MGGYFWRISDKIKQYASKKNIVISWAIFLLLLVGLNLLMEDLTLLSIDKHLFIKASIIATNKLLKAILAISGILALYLTATRYMMNHTLKNWIVNVGNYGYGVYIFHQFILKYLFYHTALPIYVGTIWLPWVGFLIATIGSILLTWLLRKTEVGRSLI